MKKSALIIICVLGIILMSAVTSLKWKQISDITTTAVEINRIHGISGNIETTFNKVSNNINPHDSVFFKNEVTAFLNLKANILTGIKYVAPIGPTAMGIGFAASDAFVANTVYAVKFYLPYSLTVNNLAFHITTGAAGGTISWAIYSENKNTKLVSAQSIDATNTGVITSNVTATTLVSGWYWVAYSNSVNTIRIMAPYSYGSTAFDADIRVQGTAANSAVSGVMPASLGVISTNYLKVPMVSLNN